ncbi:HIT family protein [Moraxella nasicaprae]|uniref:HIT domain-containing protein n=1 Tax=Moraxella nasicaprae TaxID=2904122 RepID=A0ABY6F4X9_9GAMM|nr:HIT domain-containing protein [Moraxella nasicaprae]UXZ05144.1 HIT domain-containing protein [Moraxella nasicaprae]
MSQIYDDNNIFSKILRGEIPCHRVYEDEMTLAFMDIMPDTRGHVLVIPKCKAVNLADLPLDYGAAVLATAQKVMKAQQKVLGVEGSVALQLNGSSIGQSVFHYHLHLIPTNLYNISRDPAPNKMANHDELAALAKELAHQIHAK